MFRRFFLLLLLFPLLGSDYPMHLHPSYWQDEFTLRSHISYYLLGNMIAAPEALVKWDTSKGYYTNTLPELLQYKRIMNSRYRHVTADKLIIEESQALYFYNYLSLPPAEMAHTFDSLSALLRTEEQTLLAYDDNGNLLQKIKRKSLTLPGRSAVDTTDYRYITLSDGSLQIEQQNSSFDYTKHYYGSNNVFGEMKGKAYTFKVKSETNFTFNLRRQLIRVQSPAFTSDATYGNAHKSFTMPARCRFSAYDEIGRFISFIDSTGQADIPVHKAIYTYEDIPLQQLLQDTDTSKFPILAVPVIHKWLFSHTFPIFTKMIEENFTGNNLVKKEINYSVTDQSQQLLLYADTVQESYSGNKIFHYTADSAGIYRGEYVINPFPDLKDTMTFDPDRKYIGVPYTHGCIVGTYYADPKGTIKTSFVEYNQRTITGNPGSWQIVSYGRYQGNDYLWAPQKLYFQGINPQLTDFILLDPQGFIRYYCENHELIRLTYQ